MTENERVKEIRKRQKMTMRQFGERIGLGSSTISDIENGRRSLTLANRKAICREFSIREDWLRDGSEPMEFPAPANCFEALAQKYPHMTHGTLALIESLVELEEEKQLAVAEFLEKVIEKLGSVSPSCPALPQGPLDLQTSEAEIEAGAKRAADLYRDAAISEKKPASPASSVKESDAG